MAPSQDSKFPSYSLPHLMLLSRKCLCPRAWSLRRCSHSHKLLYTWPAHTQKLVSNQMFVNCHGSIQNYWIVRKKSMVSLPFLCNSQMHVSSLKPQWNPLHIEMAYLASLYIFTWYKSVSINFLPKLCSIFSKTLIKKQGTSLEGKGAFVMDGIATGIFRPKKWTRTTWSKNLKKLTKNSRTSVIRIVQEDPVIGHAIHNLAASTFDSTLVTKKYCIQILSGDLYAGVILPR